LTEAAEQFPVSPARGPATAPSAPGGETPSSTTGHVGGPRHYQGPTLGPLLGWKCPACAAENSGPLDAGCSSCGSGSAPARHVGVPPKPRAGTLEAAFDFYKVATTAIDHIHGPELGGFDGWYNARYRGQFSPVIVEILKEAWATGIAWYREEMEGQAATPPETVPEAGIATVLLPKVLLNRVIELLEVTSDLPDGQQSEELLGLIAQLKERMDA
jgi:hypothetical protein